MRILVQHSSGDRHSSNCEITEKKLLYPPALRKRTCPPGASTQPLRIIAASGRSGRQSQEGTNLRRRFPEFRGSNKRSLHVSTRQRAKDEPAALHSNPYFFHLESILSIIAFVGSATVPLKPLFLVASIKSLSVTPLASDEGSSRDPCPPGSMKISRPA